jgi:hypothetical protein
LPISKFDLTHLGNGHDAEGPGIYFTKSYQDAINYVFPPNGRLYTVQLNLRKTIPFNAKVNRKEVISLINQSSNLEIALSNWDENPNRAKTMLVDSCLNATDLWDAFQNVWVNAYRHREVEFLAHLVEMGYDAALTDPAKTGGVEHIVVFNPSSIQVVKEDSPFETETS